MLTNILFGLNLDGTAPRTAEGLGRLAVGPRGLLEFLELHTGLYAAPVSHIERLASFLSALKASQADLPSYATSFEADPFATAACLLGWLDAWRLHGWDGGLPEGAPPRLRELVMAARRAGGRVAPSEGERFARVAEAIGGGAKLPPLSLELCEREEDYPKAIRRVLHLLGGHEREYHPMAEPTSDLGKLQAFLSGGARPEFSGDGSLRLLAPKTGLGAARLLASGALDGLVIADGGSGLWDEACLSQNRPRPACFASSPNRPALQVLPLALALLRDPLDAESLLAFLSHPLCPIGYAGRFFARALADDGGMGGPSWQKALEAAARSYEKFGNDPARIEALLAQWIPSKRYPPEELPLEALASTAGSVAQRFQALLHRADPAPSPAESEAYESAIGQCGLFRRSLELIAASYGKLPYALVQDLLSSASEAMGKRPEGFRELGADDWVGAPGALAEAVPHLVWLLPAKPSSPEPWPWSRAEIAALSSCGLALPELSALNARLEGDWARAACLATESLSIILPPEGEESHPLLLLLGSIAPALEREDREARSLLEGGKGESRIERVGLPRAGRWWKLGSSVAPDGEWKSSYSQIQTFIDRPAQWVLEYKARLETSDILSMPERRAMAGSFAHALAQDCIDAFGARAADLGEKEFSAWYEKAFDRILGERGSVWLEAGALQDQLRLRSSLQSSLRSLFGQLRSLDVVKLESEKRLRGKLFGASYEGAADIVLETGKGQRAILDMKNSYWRAGYEAKLALDTDIQLTIYAELYRQEAQVRPETAYFLIPLERTLARESSIFVDALRVESGSTAAERLEKLGASVEWRRALLEKGEVEVVCLDTAGAEDSAKGPEKGLPLQEPFDEYDPFVGIYGWGESE